MLTQGNRVEEVQREEEIGGSACVGGKNCTTYYICVGMLALVEDMGMHGVSNGCHSERRAPKSARRRMQCVLS
jgi:hypothetical protein